MTFRRILFWLHLLTGISVGIVVFIMSVTGIALTYQKQMTEWADRSYWPAAPLEHGPRLSVESIISKAREAQPDAKPSAVTFYSDPAAPAMIAVSSGSMMFVNTYTGATTNGGSTAIRSFFRVMTDWHRYLGAGTDRRATGRAITGACNLGFLFIVSSGIYLWWPRNWSLRSLRSITWFKRGLAGRPRDFNWHNVFGFWTAVPLFFIVLAGVVISYPWANSMVYSLAGSPQPNRAAGPARGGVAGVGDPANWTPLDQMILRAQETSRGWRTMNVRLPGRSDAQVSILVDRSFGGQPQMRSTLFFDAQKGSLLRAQGFADQTRGERARSWFRFVHTGEFYGLTGQTVAGIACGAGAMLVFTGLSLAVRRFYGWVGRRKVIPAEVVSRVS